MTRRLVLTALCAAVVLGLLWIGLRNRRRDPLMAELDRAAAAYLIEQAQPSAPLTTADGRWYRRQRVVRQPRWERLPEAGSDEVPRARVQFEYDVRYTRLHDTREDAAADNAFELLSPDAGAAQWSTRTLNLVYREGAWQRLSGDCAGEATTATAVR